MLNERLSGIVLIDPKRVAKMSKDRSSHPLFLFTTYLHVLSTQESIANSYKKDRKQIY